MENYDFYKHYDFCESNQLVLSFNGKVSDSILQDIITILEDKLSDYNVEKSYTRRFISIVIELTQNIQRYSFRKTINHDKEIGHGMLVVRKAEKGFQIYAGNILTPEKGKKLIGFCNRLMKLNQESLKDLYQKKLKAKRSSTSDSAGIGLLHVLRKSNSRVEITSYPVDDSSLFLAFSVLVQ